MDEALTILIVFILVLGAYLIWRQSAGFFVWTCRREFRYLMDEHGFTAEPLVFFGGREPFGCRFQGPKLAIIVQGIQWGSATHVYLETGDPEAEWAAELERLRSTNSEKTYAATELMSINDEILMRSRLPAHWLLDQRLPGWRYTENNQLAQIHDYAAALRNCADDLFSGDLSALPELFGSYAEHRRQQDSRGRQEMAIMLAQEAERPRTRLEQEIIVQGTHRSISYLRTECKVLLKALSKNPEANSLLRFVESWQALAECLRYEATRFTSLQGLEASRIVEGLRNAENTVTSVRAALALGKADHFLAERVAALDRQGKELSIALEGLSCG